MIFKYLIIFTLLFHFLGFIYNKKVRKINGKLAIPNVEKLELIKKLFINILQNIKRIIKKQKQHGYSVVWMWL